MDTLVSARSDAVVPPGHGLFGPRLYVLIKAYGWPRPTQNADVEDIDMAAPVGVGRGPGHHHLRHAAREQAEVEGFSNIVHADYRSARCGVHAYGRAVAAA